MLNYRVTGDYRAPFRIFPSIEETGPHRVEVVCMLRAELPEGTHGSNVVVNIPLPRATVGATFELSAVVPGCGAEYNAAEKRVIWNIKKMPGGSEISIRVKLTLDQAATTAIKKEIGPISLNFEVPMHNVSGLQVRHLRISETHKSYNPYRWVRYVSLSSSYVCRL